MICNGPLVRVGVSCALVHDYDPLLVVAGPVNNEKVTFLLIGQDNQQF